MDERLELTETQCAAIKNLFEAVQDVRMADIAMTADTDGFLSFFNGKHVKKIIPATESRGKHVDEWVQLKVLPLVAIDATWLDHDDGYVGVVFN